MRPKTRSWNPWTLYLHFNPAWDTIRLEVYTNQWVVVESQAEVAHSCWLWGRKSLAYVGGIGLSNFWYGWYDPSYAPQFQSGIVHQARTLGYLFTYHCIFWVWCRYRCSLLSLGASICLPCWKPLPPPPHLAKAGWHWFQMWFPFPLTDSGCQCNPLATQSARWAVHVWR